MQQISILIGLILVGNGFCQVYQNPESYDEDLMASAATLFGPKTFGIGHANLGNFGPFGYGGLGGMRIGSVGPLHFGHIGGIHTDSFLGAPNPNAEEDESPGSIGTLTGGKSYQENVGNPMEQNWQQNVGNPMEQNYQEYVGNPMEQNWQEIVGNPMEQNWQQIVDQENNFVGMEPNEQQMWELGLQPQVPDNSRAFLNDGLFGVKDDKLDKFEKIPTKPALPPKFPKPPPKFQPPPPTPPPPPSYAYYGNHGNHDSHGSDYSSHGSDYGSNSNQGTGYRSYGGHGHIRGGYGHGIHGHGIHGHGVYGHGAHGFNKYGSHGHGGHFHGSHSVNYHGGYSNAFRANDESETMPYGYNSNDQYQELYQINDLPEISVTTNPYHSNIILIHRLPSSQPSARSSVDDMLNGLDDIGFDFEFRDLIEDVFLTPYLGLLDPNDLDDDTLLLL